MKKKAINFRPQIDTNIGDKYLLKEKQEHFLILL